MVIKGIIDEDFSQYYLPTMTIASAYCSFKCDRLNNCQICQNWELAKAPNIEVSNELLINRYLRNPITKAICFGGLDILDQFYELISFIQDFRKVSNDLIIIYTGYTDSEARITGQRKLLETYPNIIVKWGRFIMNQPHHYDPILGVMLASPNQYAEKIS